MSGADTCFRTGRGGVGVTVHFRAHTLRFLPLYEVLGSPKRAGGRVGAGTDTQGNPPPPPVGSIPVIIIRQLTPAYKPANPDYFDQLYSLYEGYHEEIVGICEPCFIVGPGLLGKSVCTAVCRGFRARRKSFKSTVCAKTPCYETIDDAVCFGLQKSQED